jgi:hypothetical protein
MQVWRVQAAWIAGGDRFEVGGEFGVERKPTAPDGGWQSAIDTMRERHGIERETLIEVSACLLQGEPDEDEQERSAADTEPPRAV